MKKYILACCLIFILSGCYSQKEILAYENGGANNYIRVMSAKYREEELRLLESRKIEAENNKDVEIMKAETNEKPKEPKRILTYDDDIYTTGKERE